MTIIIEIDTVTRVQALDEPVWILYSANTFGKGMNLTIFPPAMGKIVGQTRIFNLDMATYQGGGKLGIQTC